MAGLDFLSIMDRMSIHSQDDVSGNTKLDTYNSDLNLIIDKRGYAAEPMTQPVGFCFCWAGARATHGVLSDKVCFEVFVTENLYVEFGEEHNENDPHIVRVGWSIDSHNFQLGEAEHSYGYGGTGMFSQNMKFTKYGERFGKGDVIMALIDLDEAEPRISYCKNGRQLGIAGTIKNFQRTDRMAMFPHVLSKNCKFEVNFGQKTHRFAPPSGYVFIDHVHTKLRGMLSPRSKSQCEIIMVVGLPGAGKTTWCLKQQREQFHKRYNIIGTDTLIDKMRVNGLPRNNNYHGRWEVLISKATQCLNKLFETASASPRNYILDQTNVYVNARKRKLRSFDGFKKICAVIQPDDEELRRREYKRTNEDGKFVPEDAVNEMKTNYVLPSKQEHYIDEIVWVELPRQQCHSLVEMYNNVKKRKIQHRGHSNQHDEHSNQCRGHSNQFHGYNNQYHGHNNEHHRQNNQRQSKSRSFGKNRGRGANRRAQSCTDLSESDFYQGAQHESWACHDVGNALYGGGYQAYAASQSHYNDHSYNRRAHTAGGRAGYNHGRGRGGVAYENPEWTGYNPGRGRGGFAYENPEWYGCYDVPIQSQFYVPAYDFNAFLGYGPPQHYHGNRRHSRRPPRY